MKKKFHKSKKLTLILTLILSMGLGFAAERVYAYFTTYATAKGTVPVSLGTRTELTEEYADWKKTISVKNTGDVTVYVRVKVFGGSQFTITAEGTNWSLGTDGYYYYSLPVAVGETTENIVASIEKTTDVTSSFNIIVVQECTPVMYDEDGNPLTAETADWYMQAQYEVDENGNTTTNGEEAEE